MAHLFKKTDEPASFNPKIEISTSNYESLCQSVCMSYISLNAISTFKKFYYLPTYLPTYLPNAPIYLISFDCNNSLLR